METKSLCPECLAVCEADIVSEDGRMVIVKKCESHGEFRDLYFSDSSAYDKFQKFEASGNGLLNPITEKAKGCPHDCGICPNHRTHTLLANIDVTNRCNFACPTCFANVRSSGYVYEPSMEQIRGMMRMLRDEKPVPCYAIQFSGGEPTVRRDLPEIIRMAREMGFHQIMIATNGMKLAQSKDYCRELRNTPLSTIYLQFDGVTETPYNKLRGFNALPLKLKALHNMRETGLGNIVLVPTVMNGVNADQGGDIIRFALKNIDIVRGVNFQPVSFTGRVSKEELRTGRITIPDLLLRLEKQTGGQIKASDFYPVPSASAISDLAEAWMNEPQVRFTVHPHCGCATYIFEDRDEIVPITRFVDIDGLLACMKRVSNEHKGSKLAKILITEKLLQEIPRYVDHASMPRDIDVVSVLREFVKGDMGKAIVHFHQKSILVGAMHFMDPYNFDLDRVRDCGIHYATPDGRVIPFCTYNIFYRNDTERRFGKAVDVESLKAIEFKKHAGVTYPMEM